MQGSVRDVWAQKPQPMLCVSMLKMMRASISPLTPSFDTKYSSAQYRDISDSCQSQSSNFIRDSSSFAAHSSRSYVCLVWRAAVEFLWCLSLVWASENSKQIRWALICQPARMRFILIYLPVASPPIPSVWFIIVSRKDLLWAGYDFKIQREIGFLPSLSEDYYFFIFALFFLPHVFSGLFLIRFFFLCFFVVFLVFENNFPYIQYFFSFCRNFIYVYKSINLYIFNVCGIHHWTTVRVERLSKIFFIFLVFFIIFFSSINMLFGISQKKVVCCVCRITLHFLINSHFIKLRQISP